MLSTQNLFIFGIFFAFILVEGFRVGIINKKDQVKNDGWVELISTLMLFGFTQPTIILTVQWLGLNYFPDYQNALVGIHLVFAILLFLIFDDMMQYWWHRTSHNVKWLYNLHRPHHNAAYMSVRLVYRNNIFYYMMMPGIWFSAALIYLGLGWVYAGYIVVKLTVIIGAHCDVHWDRPLYKIKALSPFMWLVERTISTPSTHSMHHGKHLDDGITHYKGNYSNLLFFWDILFGTARITRKRPPSYGVENLPETSLGEQLLWPIFRAK